MKKPSSTSPKLYFTEDTDPLPGISYYRLRQVDFDGQNETFTPVAVVFESNSIQDLIASSTDHTINVQFNSNQESEVELYVTDNLGRQLIFENRLIQHGNNEFQLVDLASGVYYITLRNGNEVKTVKVMN